MIKAILIIIVLTVNIFVYAQQPTAEVENPEETEISGKLFYHEVRLNILSTALLVPELNYELLFPHLVGLGLAATYPPYQMGEGTTPLYQILPFIRFYISKKRGVGFFIEGNLNFYGKKRYDRLLEEDVTVKYTGAGFALGYKGFLSFLPDKWLGELYFGLGELSNYPGWAYSGTYPRIGIGVGKRF